MIKRLLLLFLLLLILVGAYLWYRQTPEQQIGRTVDQFLENIEHRKITTRRQVDVHESLREVLAEKVDFQGDSPIPHDQFSLDEILTKVDQLHTLTNLVEMTHLERSIKIIGSKAQVYQSSKVRGVAGLGPQRYESEETWDLVIDLQKDEDWRIIGVRGSRR